ncbi:MAG: hypothetical protein RR687_15485, partial [Comamonas sp.]
QRQVGRPRCAPVMITARCRSWESGPVGLVHRQADFAIGTEQVAATTQQRPAIGFLARSVAEHFERQGLLCTLNLKVPIELPHVGIITLRGRAKTPASQLLVDSLRETVASR